MPVARANNSVPLAEILPPHKTREQAAASLTIGQHFLGWKPDDNFRRLQPLNAETKQWVVDIADFMANCGGCRQW